MKALDPGHIYFLTSLDGGGHEVLNFVKREGPTYPGNKGSHPGTTVQEVCRALIDRLHYVDNQIPDSGNVYAIKHLQQVIWELENRAAKRHGSVLITNADDIELLPVCSECGHLECTHHVEVSQ